jgi:hypothetical protein
MALVSLVLRKIALFPEFLWSCPARLALSFWLRKVKFFAMFLRTVFILASFVVLPDEALEFRRIRSSSFSFKMAALIAYASESLIF